MNPPQERQISSGRTFTTPYNRAAFGPIQGPYRSPRHITDWILVGILFVVLAVLYFGV